MPPDVVHGLRAALPPVDAPKRSHKTAGGAVTVWWSAGKGVPALNSGHAAVYGHGVSQAFHCLHGLFEMDRGQGRYYKSVPRPAIPGPPPPPFGGGVSPANPRKKSGATPKKKKKKPR